MELTIFWTEFSEKELDNIFNYFKEKVGVKFAKKLVNEIYSEALKTTSFPEIGQKEEFLKGIKEDFRYLIVKNYKLIYWVNRMNNEIIVIDVFDTRQNPVKLKRGIK